MEPGMKSSSIVIALSLVLLWVRAARADESLLPLAESGSWVAFEHRVDMTAPPDVCMAGNVAAHIIFRADANDTEVRYSNDKWSLPSNVSGQIVLTISGTAHSFPINSNTNNMVSATVPAADVAGLLDLVASAPSMTVKTGNAAATPVSLDGSKVALTAFRTCAGIGGGSAGAGTNPCQ
jgi:hypothetical protein